MNIVPEEVKKKFDETLVRSLERNLGATQELDGLSLNLTAVSSLVLLVERESEMEMFPEDSPGRFTKDTFFNELEKVGLDSEKEVRQEIQQMIERGYIDVESDGSLLAQKPAKEMVRIFDKAFPGMPGMNLVAYLIQTLEEALSGRKKPDFAILQLEQTLQMHGGLNEKETVASCGSKSQKNGKQSTYDIKSALSATLRKRQATLTVTSEPKIVTSGGAVKPLEVKEVFSSKEESLEIPPALHSDTERDTVVKGTLAKGGDTEQSEAIDITGSVDSDHVDTLSEEASGFLEGDEPYEPDEQTEEVPQSGSAEAVGKSASHTFLEGTVKEADDVENPAIEDQAEDDDLHQERTSTSETADEIGSVSQQDSAVLSDDDLEARIAAFEQDLAMICPLCGGGKVETKETAKGKTFYVCTQQECVFVSWGKPYHLECPWCKNPFLIEAKGKAGKSILRCPRATCRYQQGMPGEDDSSTGQSAGNAQGTAPSTRTVRRRPRKRKRAVRRRVVRRKRS
jgi:hypothetical protein